MADRVPNWGPSAGQPVPDAAWAAYMQTNPPPEGASFSAGPAIIGSDGTPGQVDGKAIDPTPEIIKQITGQHASDGLGALDPWTQFFATPQDVSYTGFDSGQADQSKASQFQMMQDLAKQARGDLDTTAQQQLTRGYGQASQSQMALASGQRGAGGGAGLRNGVMGAGNSQRGFTSDQSTLRAQEMSQGNAALTALLSQMYGQDVNQANGQANAALGAQGLNNDYLQFLAQGGINAASANGQYGVDLAGARAGTDIDNANIAAASNNKLVQGGATALAALSRMGSSGGSDNNPSRYRQVDGQDSIVPEDDK